MAFLLPVEPGTTFFVRETTDGSAFCMSETQGIGPHYLTSVSYMGGGSDVVIQ